MLDPFVRLSEYDAAIDALDQIAGIQPSTEWVQMRERFDDFRDIDYSHVTTQLAARVRDGAPAADLIGPLTFAVATSGGPGALRDVHRAVLKLLTPHLTELAAQHGRTAHAALAKKFNTAAAKLAAGVKIAAPTITADEAIRADTATRTAFLARADLLSSMEALHTGLRQAAELTGARLNRDTAMSLVVDFDKVAPDQNREVWELLGDRINWTALAALDVLGARPLGTPASPRHPGLEERWEQNQFGHGRRLFDPIANAYV